MLCVAPGAGAEPMVARLHGAWLCVESGATAPTVEHRVAFQQQRTPDFKSFVENTLIVRGSRPRWTVAGPIVALPEDWFEIDASRQQALGGTIRFKFTAPAGPPGTNKLLLHRVAAGIDYACSDAPMRFRFVADYDKAMRRGVSKERADALAEHIRAQQLGRGSCTLSSRAGRTTIDCPVPLFDPRVELQNVSIPNTSGEPVPVLDFIRIEE